MAHQLKEYIADQHQIPDETLNLLNSMYWMDPEEMLATDEQKQAAVLEPIEALKSHMHLLSEHVLYVSHTRTQGSIGELKSEEGTRQNLLDFETELYSYMCSIKIALLSAGQEYNSTITDDVLKSRFLEASTPLLNATYRTYITIQDSVRLMEFLNEICRQIELSLHDTEA